MLAKQQESIDSEQNQPFGSTRHLKCEEKILRYDVCASTIVVGHRYCRADRHFGFDFSFTPLAAARFLRVRANFRFRCDRANLDHSSVLCPPHSLGLHWRLLAALSFSPALPYVFIFRIAIHPRLSGPRCISNRVWANRTPGRAIRWPTGGAAIACLCDAGDGGSPGLDWPGFPGANA